MKRILSDLTKNDYHVMGDVYRFMENKCHTLKNIVQKVKIATK